MWCSTINWKSENICIHVFNNQYWTNMPQISILQWKRLCQILLSGLLQIEGKDSLVPDHHLTLCTMVSLVFKGCCRNINNGVTLAMYNIDMDKNSDYNPIIIGTTLLPHHPWLINQKLSSVLLHIFICMVMSCFQW